jgi:hypothetical protein
MYFTNLIHLDGLLANITQCTVNQIHSILGVTPVD